MKDNQNPAAGRTNDATDLPEHDEDHVSDPALATDPGHDWTDEGGATPSGPATSTDGDD